MLLFLYSFLNYWYFLRFCPRPSSLLIISSHYTHYPWVISSHILIFKNHILHIWECIQRPPHLKPPLRSIYPQMDSWAYIVRCLSGTSNSACQKLNSLSLIPMATASPQTAIPLFPCFKNGITICSKYKLGVTFDFSFSITSIKRITKFCTCYHLE